ncbi:SMI1/KNR4 family protein [Streptomyces sp. S6]
MDVEIPPSLIETAAQYGAGVPYALKVVAARLADDPDLGRPSSLPGILKVLFEGDLVEDCPALAIGYIREPDRVRIRYVSPTDTPTEPADTTPEPDPTRTDPATDALTARQVADAWHRITAWLRDNAPDSYAALRPATAPAPDLGVPVPVELRTLWTLAGGDDHGCLPGAMGVMPPSAVAAEYRRRTEYEWWKPSWIPFAAGPRDSMYGTYLDSETGFLGRWSHSNDDWGNGELDTLVTYLEETADMLEAPSLATRDRPGLVGGRLVWRSAVPYYEESEWRPV